jgi:membrane protease YdiL (CAAX protease family)
MNAFREFVRRHEVVIALSLIVVNNALFVGGIASKILPGGLYYFGRFLLLGSTLGVVILIGSGWKGILDLLRPLARWRISPWWYLLALAWPTLISVMVLTGKGMINGTGLSEITTDFSVVTHPAVMKTIVIGSFIGEIVWVSYAIRHFSNKFTPFIGSQIVGVVWTLWWMPMVLLNVGVFPGLPPLALLFSMLGVAAMCSFIYWHTKSGLTVLALQMMVNSTALVFPILPDTGGVATYYAFAGVYYICVLMLYLRYGPKPILAGRKEEPQASVLAS